MDPGRNLQPAWYRAITAEGFAVLARYWHDAGISTTYHWRGSERWIGWKFSIGTGGILDIDIMPTLKFILVHYWHYCEVGCYPTRGLRTETVLCQYHANPRPGTNCPVQVLILVYNWRGTVPFVNTGMNQTFPSEYDSSLV